MSDIPNDSGADQSRRTWIAVTAGAGALGGVAVAVPFVSTFAPSERAKAAGAAVEADVSALQRGLLGLLPRWGLHLYTQVGCALAAVASELHYGDPQPWRQPACCGSSHGRA